MVEERPYDERPPARPIVRPATAGEPSDTPGARSKKKSPWVSVVAVVGTAAVAFGFILALNMSRPATPDAASPACDAAFETASDAMNDHYATHPFFGPEYDAIYADGVVSDDERVTLDAMLADEEAKFMALVEPVYNACSGVEDLYAGAFAHRDDADWALLDVESMSREDIKAGFIFSHCYKNEVRPACTDFVLEDWSR